MNILIGADPEIFVKRNNKIISAHGLVPGTKQKPFKVTNGAVQVDGMALEFNINPASTLLNFRRNLKSVLSELKAMIPEDLKFSHKCWNEFSEEYMNEIPEEAKTLGCDVDHNAYSEKENIPPNPLSNIRTVAGHIHIGWTNDRDPHEYSHFRDCCELTKQLDLYLGLPASLIDKEDVRYRKIMYGEIGSFRPKPYGLEYRVLSNFWITRIKYVNWVFNNTKSAFYDLLKNWNKDNRRNHCYRYRIAYEGRTRRFLEDANIQLPL